jgi:hypothetical protein
VRYDDLPELGDLGVRHAWDIWPNSLGTLNRITPQSVLRALAIPRQGRRISLDLPLGSVDPPLYGRTQLTHRVFDRNRNMVEDELTDLDPQGAPSGTACGTSGLGHSATSAAGQVRSWASTRSSGTAW